MTEYKFENATVRIHGTASKETIEAATIRFLKKVHKIRKQKERGDKDVLCNR